MIYRALRVADADAVCALQDTVRTTLPVYYPRVPKQTVREFIAASEREPGVYLALGAFAEELLGFTSATTSDYLGIPIASCTALYAQRTLPPFTLVAVLSGLIRRTITWAESAQAARVVWNIETGEWTALARILYKYGARQIGVNIGKDLHGKQSA